MRGDLLRGYAAAALALVLVTGGVAVAGPRVAVVRSARLGPFNQATEAFVSALASDPAAPEILTFDLEGDAGNAADALRRARDAHAAVFVTVGSLATAAALDEAGAQEPVVFSMVLYPRQSGFVPRAGRQVTGASLDVSAELQFRYLHRLLPSARRVGVLHSTAETGAVVDNARTAAGAQGLTLVTSTVNEPGEALGALGALMEQVDVVWAVADSHVFTPQTTSPLVLAALRRGVPLIGLSSAHVRTGALAAFACDYADIGRQTADLAARVLHGTPANTLAVTTPRVVTLALNLRTAEHLGLPIARDLTDEAGEVVR